MVSQSSAEALEVHGRIKKMGYTTGNQIHIYGEKFEVLADPFEEGSGIGVRVKQLTDGVVRVLRLPATLLQSARKGVA
jgi:hypothetical protein